MNPHAKAIRSLSLALSLLAAAIFLLAPPPVRAQAAANLCYYAGQSYSPGAIIQAACPQGKVQYCQSNGTWTVCIPPPVTGSQD